MATDGITQSLLLGAKSSNPHGSIATVASASEVTLHSTGVLSKTTAKEFADYLKETESNDAKAQTRVGLCYYFGFGTAKNLDNAIEFFSAAARQNHAPALQALTNIALRYHAGLGIPVNRQKANVLFDIVQTFQPLVRLFNFLNHSNLQDWSNILSANTFSANTFQANTRKFFQREVIPTLNREANNKNPSKDAQFVFGFFYLAGLGITQNVVKAVELFEAANQQGHMEAPLMLGSLHDEGKVRHADSKIIEEYYQTSADRGSIDAEYTLAEYLKKQWCGSVVSSEEDRKIHDELPQRILNLTQNAANRGSPDAQYSLAYIYCGGIFSSIINVRDDRKSVSFFHLAAAKGSAASHSLLAAWHRGGHKVPNDISMSFKHYAKGF